MTRSRLAAAAALSIPALLVPASGGEAQRDDVYRLDTTCRTKHTDGQRLARASQGADFQRTRSELMRRKRSGSGRQGSAAAFVPVKGAKVITKMTDLTTSDGNNVLDAKDSDRTNDNGVAKTSHEFNNFGNYRVKVKAKVDGEVVATDEFTFGVFDRESGKCEPAQPTG